MRKVEKLSEVEKAGLEDIKKNSVVAKNKNIREKKEKNSRGNLKIKAKCQCEKQQIPNYNAPHNSYQ